GVGFDRHAVGLAAPRGTPRLDMVVGGGVLGMPGVPDPSDQLPRLDPGAPLDPGSDTPPLAVICVRPVGTPAVIVEMDVPGDPTIGMTNAQIATVALVWADPDDLACCGCHNRDALLPVGHDVVALVFASSRARGSEGVAVVVIPLDGEDQRVENVIFRLGR